MTKIIHMHITKISVIRVAVWNRVPGYENEYPGTGIYSGTRVPQNSANATPFCNLYGDYCHTPSWNQMAPEPFVQAPSCHLRSS
jgi:hypothetical protein